MQRVIPTTPTARWTRAAVSTAAIAVLALSSLSFGAVVAHAAPIVGAEVLLVSDGTAQETANGCLVADPDSSLADENPTDGIVCTDDTVMYGWHYSVPASGSDDVVFSQTLPAGWSWDALSLISCSGGDDFTGVPALSADGLTFSCTMTFANTGEARSGQLPVWATPEPGVADGSTYAAQLVVTDDATTVPVDPAATVTVRSQPRWNLLKSNRQVTYGEVADFGAGDEPAVVVSYWIFIHGQSGNNFKGQDALAPLTFTDVVSGIDPEALLSYCSNDGEVLGDPNQTVVACSQDGGVGSDITFAFPLGMDVPIVSANAIPATAFVGRVAVAIPMRSVPVYPLTRTTLNQVNDFDPNGVSSGSNLGEADETGSEAGAVCVAGNGNDNCAWLPVSSPPSGVGSIDMNKSLRQFPSAGSFPEYCGYQWYWCEPLEGVTGTSANDARVGNQDGVAYRSDQFWAGFGVSWDPARELPANTMACDVWDNQLQQFDPAGMTTIGGWNEAVWDAWQPTLQFTDQVFADDAARENADCGTWADTADGPWYDTVDDVPGGADAVTGARWLVPVSAATWGSSFLLPMKVDDSVPTGTIVPDFAHLYFDQAVTPENEDGWSFEARDSYRVNELQILIDKDTVPAGVTGTVAGARVPFSLQVSTNLRGSGGDRAVDGVNVVDTLDTCFADPLLDPSITDWTMAITAADLGPDGLSCTADDVSGAVLTFTPTSVVLTGEPLEKILYSVAVSGLISNGVMLLNTAVVNAANGVTLQTEAGRSDQWELTAAAPGAVRVSKVADFPLVEIDPDDLSWTIIFSNSLSSALGQTQFIDVLPYNGDGRGTSFSGEFGFAGAQVILGTDTTVFYTTDAVATIAADPATNASVWVAASSTAATSPM